MPWPSKLPATAAKQPGATCPVSKDPVRAKHRMARLFSFIVSSIPYPHSTLDVERWTFDVPVLRQSSGISPLSSEALAKEGDI